MNALVHRVVPFVSGAALAIILDTGMEMARPRPDVAPAAVPAREPAITAVPAQRPSVVPREGREEEPEPAIAEVSPGQEIRAPSSRRAERSDRDRAAPSFKELDAALTRALARRGLEPDDLDRIESLRAAVSKLRAAKAAGEVREAGAAGDALVAAVQSAPLSHALLEKKLEQVRTALTQAEASMPKERFSVLQANYLDAKLELPSLGGGALDAFAVKLARLLKEIRDAAPR